MNKYTNCSIRVTRVRHGFIVTFGKGSLLDLDASEQSAYAFSTVAELQAALPVLLGLDPETGADVAKESK